MPNSFISNTYVSNPNITVKDNVIPVPIATAGYFAHTPLKMHVNYSVELNIDNSAPYDIFLSEQESGSILNNQTIDLTDLPETTASLIHNSTAKLMGVTGFFEVEIDGLDKPKLYNFKVELKSSNEVIDTKSTSILVYINGEKNA